MHSLQPFHMSLIHDILPSYAHTGTFQYISIELPKSWQNHLEAPFAHTLYCSFDIVLFRELMIEHKTTQSQSKENVE